MATTIVDQTNHSDIARMIASRAERGRDLYLTKRQLITKTSEDIYTVPASNGGVYTVHYDVESCECTDSTLRENTDPVAEACSTRQSVSAVYQRWLSSHNTVYDLQHLNNKTENEKARSAKGRKNGKRAECLAGIMHQHRAVCERR